MHLAPHGHRHTQLKIKINKIREIGKQTLLFGWRLGRWAIVMGMRIWYLGSFLPLGLYTPFSCLHLEPVEKASCNWRVQGGQRAGPVYLLPRHLCLPSVHAYPQFMPSALGPFPFKHICLCTPTNPQRKLQLLTIRPHLGSCSKLKDPKSSCRNWKGVPFGTLIFLFYFLRSKHFLNEVNWLLHS